MRFVVVLSAAALIAGGCDSPSGGRDDLGGGADDLAVSFDLQPSGAEDLAQSLDLSASADMKPVVDLDGGGGGDGGTLLPLTPARIEFGDTFACGKRADGTVRCWGNNGNGQLGDDTLVERNRPGASVMGLTGAVQVAASGIAAGRGEAACALIQDGTVRCWGANVYGQLGDGADVDQHTPSLTLGIADARRLDVGELHFCAARASGTLSCWGYGTFYQIGNGDDLQKNLTPTTALISTQVTSAALGIHHSCAVDDVRTLWCWGYNFYGQTGVEPPSSNEIQTPTRVLPDTLTPVVEAVAAKYVTCVRLDGGAVKCWGNGDPGTLGNGQSGAAVGKVSVPQDVLGLSNVVQLGAGREHLCARSSDGTVRCWGSNQHGQLGDGTRFNRSTPVQVSNVTDAADLMVGFDNTCVRRTDGSFGCWGTDTDGQLGIGNDLIALTPATPAINDVKQISVGPGFDGVSCTAHGDGTARCWGNGLKGLLGAGNLSDATTPQVVPGLTGVSEIAVGGEQVCARTGGTVKCWGEQRWGALGDGVSPLPTASTLVTSPVDVGGVTDAAQLVAGSRFACARTATATVLCWGYDASGQLGDGGTAVNRATAAPVSGLSNVTWVAAGSDHACAVWGGNVSCWGSGSGGRLGQGTDTTNKQAPVQVAGLANITQVACGLEHTCALRNDGRVLCWGRNTEGQLGDSTYLDRKVPTIIATPTDVEVIWAGAKNTCARNTAGETYCWGDSDSGQLPDGAGVDRKTPVRVFVTSDVRTMAFSSQHGCASLVDGTTRCWGHVQNGALGNGTRQNRLLPTIVSF